MMNGQELFRFISIRPFSKSAEDEELSPGNGTTGTRGKSVPHHMIVPPKRNSRSTSVGEVAEQPLSSALIEYGSGRFQDHSEAAERERRATIATLARETLQAPLPAQILRDIEHYGATVTAASKTELFSESVSIIRRRDFNLTQLEEMISRLSEIFLAYSVLVVEQPTAAPQLTFDINIISRALEDLHFLVWTLSNEFDATLEELSPTAIFGKDIVFAIASEVAPYFSAETKKEKKLLAMRSQLAQIYEDLNQRVDANYNRCMEITAVIDELQDKKQAVIVFQQVFSEEIKAEKLASLRSAAETEQPSEAPRASSVAPLSASDIKAFDRDIHKPWFAEPNLSHRLTKDLLSSSTLGFLQQLQRKISHFNDVSDVISLLIKMRYKEVNDFLDELNLSQLETVYPLKKFHHMLKLTNVAHSNFGKIQKMPVNGLEKLEPPQPRLEFVPFSDHERRPGVRFLGWGDFLLVRERTKGYAMGDIAYIENIMKGEARSREHVNTHEIETTQVLESEIQTEESQDLQTTERFELKREIKEVIKTEVSLEAGISATVNFGKVAKIETSVKGKYGNSTQKDDNTASTYAKETTAKALSKITEKTRESTTRRVLNRTVETNKHSFENTKDGASHESGIYRFVDREVHAELINYGRRPMLEFIIPEPAAFYKYTQHGNQANQVQSASADSVKKPVEPWTLLGQGTGKIGPDNINAGNYTLFVATYAVKDVKPCPILNFTRSQALPSAESKETQVTIQGKDGWPFGDHYDSPYVSFEEIKAQPGYKIVKVSGKLTFIARFRKTQIPGYGRYGEIGTLHSDNFQPQLLIGGEKATLKIGFSGNDAMTKEQNAGNFSTLVPENSLNFQRPFVYEFDQTFSPSDETQNLAITISDLGLKCWGTVSVKYERTEEALITWQLNTFASIMSAYERQLQAYNDAMAAATMRVAYQAAEEIAARPAAINERIMRQELQKGAIRYLSQGFAHVDIGNGQVETDVVFSAMSPGKNNVPPEFDIERANLEGKIIQFFEQAFEWHNLTWYCYPYFWGRQQNWAETCIPSREPDKKFAAFLEAGAARVILPINPPYLANVINYFQTDVLWPDGKPPILEDKDNLFVSITDQIKADAQVFNEVITARIKPGEVPEQFPVIVDEWDFKQPTDLVILQQDANLNLARVTTGLTSLGLFSTPSSGLLSAPVPQAVVTPSDPSSDNPSTPGATRSTLPSLGKIE